MTNNLFRFDVRLKDLMNLGEQAKDFPKLEAIFLLLRGFWYDLKDNEEAEIERWDRIRVGSIEVFLDDENHLHLDFITRFSFENYPQILSFLEKVKES